MAITEYLAAFLPDFSQSATFGGITRSVILNTDGADIMGGRVNSNQYSMRFVTSDFPSLAYGSQITVSGTAYTVLDVLVHEDGAFSIARLEKN